MQVIQEETHSEKIDFRLWRQIFHLARPYRAYSLGLVGASAAVAVVDTIFPYLTKIAVDNFAVPQTTQGIGLFSLVFFLLIAWQAVNVYFFITLAGRVESGLAYTLRNAAFLHLQKLSFSFYDKKAAGWLMARLTSDVNRLSEIISWGVVDLCGLWRPWWPIYWPCSL